MPDTTSTTPQSAPQDYKATLNLPQTAFKMKAGAATREPELQVFWESEQVYHKAMAMRKGSPRFLLHDGPPYLSSDKIHIGTALNKILKDIVTRFKTQRGFYSPYVPGYDGHGLPIENAVVKSIKGGRSAVTPAELRTQCRSFAMGNLHGQEVNFKRLGVWGHWEKPYVTIDGQFEATQIRLFGKMYTAGHVYKGLKPVYWCTSCETALADAEVEYENHTSHDVYVAFNTMGDAPAALPEAIKSRWSDVRFVIWTTTPWTLPANLGLAFNAGMAYAFVQTPDHGILVVAQDLLADFLAKTGLEGTQVLETVLGDVFTGLSGKHPLYDRGSRVVFGDHVTAEAGTGIVHTAPGHGHEDYLAGLAYDLGILSPVDAKGHFTAEAGPAFEGMFYKAGNKAIIEALETSGALLGKGSLEHSYPHCWRCHNPVIYRATDQWFINVDGFRKQALDEIRKVEWIPARGENRISTMVENRSDWCISRQRVWGVPIPVFYCAQCQTPLLSEAITERVAKRFETETSDAWWTHDAQALLEEPTTCADCGHTEFRKEMDIMDVWFDSGVTHTAVVEARSEELGHLPVELYLEGSDQHRGWFQSSLLTSVATRGERPYQRVLTHGFVLDANGRKMSKSMGNVVDPQAVISELGADVLRLWVASVDYTNDVRIGKEMLSQLADIYRKIRNTLRFVLGNLAGFDAQRDAVPVEALSALDRYMLHRLQDVTTELTDAFETFAFHRFYQVLQNFCVTDLSALYFDVTKDILYTAHANAPERRAVQTVLFELLSTLVPMLVPVMPHLAEDIWLNIPAEHKPTFGEPEAPTSILLAPWPSVKPQYQDTSLAESFAKLLALKDAVNLTLEAPRTEGQIGSPLEAAIVLTGTAPELATVSPEMLTTLFLVSHVSINPASPLNTPVLAALDKTNDLGIHIQAHKAPGQKCPRCWKYTLSIGTTPAHPTLCPPCTHAVTS